ncbi:hypothetical protein RIF29_15606 [Crotalaria pallida]|uniref:Uncharacterized protein n=1 Tax=Crotalaria pallida TaxID=3830 RepID=A0AAN9FDX3_CROPI
MDGWRLIYVVHALKPRVETKPAVMNILTSRVLHFLHPHPPTTRFSNSSTKLSYLLFSLSSKHTDIIHFGYLMNKLYCEMH